jgi:uncharacterized protein YodC (DUF2158 family)
MAEEIKAGDVVQLKSGGPEMTVTEVGLDGFEKPTVWVVWFEKNKKESDAFQIDSVVKKR